MHTSSTRALISLSLVSAMLAATSGCSSSSDGIRSALADSRSGASEEASQGGSASSSRRLGAGSLTAANGGQGGERCSLTAVYYRYNSSDLDTRARAALDHNADCLRSQPDRSATVTGMADPRGTEEYNLALGERRARVAARYVSSRGVPNERVEVRSVGAEYARGRDEDSWSQDRRSEFSE